MNNQELHTLVLLLGSNLGNRRSLLAQAAEKINAQLGSISKASSLYETKSWGLEEQPDFLNQVLICHTAKNAAEALHHCLSIEKELGRDRKVKWGSRSIDIDILYFDDEIVATETLKIPHPFLHKRRFTLVPLVEVMPDFVHPVLNFSNKELLERCEDTLEVSLLNSK
ncbi:MAG: 2-amino-4-hydroxy-6-hydroxymethyldihydropteridine diphosphokinase [Cytophaga sp.]|uniref:2-amino-4-hydroxy-6- hydroxymethyldihydropteridine diphosphokinase n=1 Tax=Cytophaga sp. TaxID=29535 RepID=UPI003F7F6DC0